MKTIPHIWKITFLLICLWFAVNYAVGVVVEYKTATPEFYIFWNTLYLFELQVILIGAIFLYCHWLFKFKVHMQAAAHLAGALLYIGIMGTMSYYVQDYTDGFVYFENWKDHMLSLLKLESLRFPDQYLVIIGTYYVIRLSQRLQVVKTNPAV